MTSQGIFICAEPLFSCHFFTTATCIDSPMAMASIMYLSQWVMFPTAFFGVTVQIQMFAQGGHETLRRVPLLSSWFGIDMMFM